MGKPVLGSYDQELSIISRKNSRHSDDGFHVIVVLVLELVTVIHYHYSSGDRLKTMWMTAIAYTG